MKRGTIILVLFIVISLVLVGLSQFLRSQPPVQIRVAVDPLAQPWIEPLIRDFNDAEVTIGGTRRVEILVGSGSLAVVDDIDVWNGNLWTTESHPDLWIPAMSISVDYAGQGTNRKPFRIIGDSLARTPLVFVGYDERLAVLTEDGTTALSWDIIANAAQVENWRALGAENAGQFEVFRIAFTDPENSADGLAMLFSAAAGLTGSHQLGDNAENNQPGVNSLRSEFCAWFDPIYGRVANLSTIGGDIAVFMASRGRSATDIAVGPESRFIASIEAINRNAPVTAAYPEIPFVFDFPAALWEEPTTPRQTRDAAQAFVDWLLEPAQQARLADYGVRPANGVPAATSDLFENGASYGFLLDPVLSDPVEAPTMSETRFILECF